MHGHPWKHPYVSVKGLKRTLAHQLFGISYVPPQAEPPCVELQFCDSFSHETNFVNPKSIYKCIDTLDSTLLCLLMPYEDLRTPTFWNWSCPAPSSASMCGTSVLWLFESWNNFNKSKKYILMHWHPWMHPNVSDKAPRGPSRTNFLESVMSRPKLSLHLWNFSSATLSVMKQFFKSIN